MEKTMLDGLDTTPWSTLHHAYGTAEDVPDLIRALASPNPETRDETLDTLFGNIWHQGTVYEASAYAVPFLIELVAAPSVHAKADILNLLHALSDGASYLNVHANPEEAWGARWRSTLAALGRDVDAEIAKELGWVRAAHTAVVAGSAVYLTLLHAGDRDSRLFATGLLARCSDDAAAIVPVLRQRLHQEPDTQVQAGMVLACDALLPSTAEAEAFFETILATSPTPALRFTAGVSLLRRTQERAPEAAVHLMLEALRATDIPWTLAERAAHVAREQTYYPGFPWPETVSSAAIKGLTALGPARGVPAFCQALDAVEDPRTAHDLVKAVLQLALGCIPMDTRSSMHGQQASTYERLPADPGTLPLPLQAHQKMAVAAVAATDRYWETTTNLHTLWGLPEDRAMLQELSE
jgi:hypothetical protein